jgi:RNA polymerase sigma-70 factor (ECF subfamily)
MVDQTLPAEDALRQIAIEDLFLAYACSLSDKKALKLFASECDGELRAVANKLRISTSDFDDVRQRLWDKLFLASGDRSPKILEYRGKGQLRHWFRVLAARSILDDLRKSKRFEGLNIEPGDSALWRTAPQVDPELANIRQRYKDDFRAAFESALKALEPEERNLLKGHYVGGMSTEQLAKAFGIHKATAARHIAKARDKLLEHTRAHLKSQLGANSDDLDSVMRLFDGEMSISLSRMLK